MNFWDLNHTSSRCAVFDQNLNRFVSYKELDALVESVVKILPKPKNKNLGIILSQNKLIDLVAYLAAIRKKDAVFLINSKLHSNLLPQLIDNYQPEWILASKELSLVDQAYTSDFLYDHILYLANSDKPREPFYSDLALLLSTSGTTGSGKAVRLSYKNLSSNAHSISEYLQLGEHDRFITSLPMHYSYGLSVINSTLHAGGTLLLTDASIVEARFWKFAQDNEITSFAGVPYTYEILNKMHFQPLAIPSLERVMQAGGPLSHELALHLYRLSLQCGWKFYVMYGQTEATARISYLPPEKLEEKLGSIGIAIPRGYMSINDESHELVYEGPNVMLGYAYTQLDLSKGDECRGILYTGDIVEQDSDGYFFLKGRKNRFIKPLGLRINLDEMELALEKEILGSVACIGDDERLFIIVEEGSRKTCTKEFIGAFFQLPPSIYELIKLPFLPRNSSGKKDYLQISKLCIYKDLVSV